MTPVLQIENDYVPNRKREETSLSGKIMRSFIDMLSLWCEVGHPKDDIHQAVYDI